MVKGGERSKPSRRQCQQLKHLALLSKSGRLGAELPLKALGVASNQQVKGSVASQVGKAVPAAQAFSIAEQEWGRVLCK